MAHFNIPKAHIEKWVQSNNQLWNQVVSYQHNDDIARMTLGGIHMQAQQQNLRHGPHNKKFQEQQSLEDWLLTRQGDGDEMHNSNFLKRARRLINQVAAVQECQPDHIDASRKISEISKEDTDGIGNIGDKESQEEAPNAKSAEGSNPDLGILSCGDNEHECVPYNPSSLGGICLEQQVMHQEGSQDHQGRRKQQSQGGFFDYFGFYCDVYENNLNSAGTGDLMCISCYSCQCYITTASYESNGDFVLGECWQNYKPSASYDFVCTFLAFYSYSDAIGCAVLLDDSACYCTTAICSDESFDFSINCASAGFSFISGNWCYKNQDTFPGMQYCRPESAGEGYSYEYGGGSSGYGEGGEGSSGGEGNFGSEGGGNNNGGEGGGNNNGGTNGGNNGVFIPQNGGNPPNENDGTSDDKDGLSTRAIVGIAVGAALFFFGTIATVFVLAKGSKKNNNQGSAQPVQTSSSVSAPPPINITAIPSPPNSVITTPPVASSPPPAAVQEVKLLLQGDGQVVAEKTTPQANGSLMVERTIYPDQASARSAGYQI